MPPYHLPPTQFTIDNRVTLESYFEELMEEDPNISSGSLHY